MRMNLSIEMLGIIPAVLRLAAVGGFLGCSP
jgi:hypothetical protein